MLSSNFILFCVEWRFICCSYRCDADPIILADYVIALLSHDGPEYEMRKMFTKQLEEFLDQRMYEFLALELAVPP